MKVYVVVDMTLEEPENFGLRVYSTREKAEAVAKALEEQFGEDKNGWDYKVSIEDAEIDID